MGQQKNIDFPEILQGVCLPVGSGTVIGQLFLAVMETM